MFKAESRLAEKQRCREAGIAEKQWKAETRRSKEAKKQKNKEAEKQRRQEADKKRSRKTEKQENAEKQASRENQTSKEAGNQKERKYWKSPKQCHPTCMYGVYISIYTHKYIYIYS